MFYKYKFPFNLFLIFEKLNPIIYSSNCLSSNHYIILVPNEWYSILMKCCKNEVFFSNSTLIDHSSIDSKNYNSNYFFNTVSKNILSFTTLYFYFIKVRITFMISLYKDTMLTSIDNLYYNSSWLERENSEMFNINYYFKKDIRNLLLDYSRNEYPMLKEFPCEGYFDVYYDFFEDQLKYIESEFVEL